MSNVKQRGISPGVNGAYAWRARATFNHRSFKDYLKILAVPVFGNLFQHIAHALLIDQALAGSHRAASPDPRADDYELIRVGIDHAGDDGVILVGSSFLLLRTIQDPSVFAWSGTVFNPELRHVVVVREMKTQWRGQS